jgi:hypothetical protein
VANSPPVRSPATGRTPTCSPCRGAPSALTPSGAGAPEGTRRQRWRHGGAGDRRPANAGHGGGREDEREHRKAKGRRLLETGGREECQGAPAMHAGQLRPWRQWRRRAANWPSPELERRSGGAHAVEGSGAELRPRGIGRRSGHERERRWRSSGSR